MDSKELDEVLGMAVDKNDYKAIPHLINAGANPDAISYDHSYNLLGQAVINGHFKCAEALFKGGADANQAVPLSGTTATHTLGFYLYSAGKLMKNAEKWVELFLDNNADFNKISEKHTKQTPEELLFGEAKEVYDKVIASYSPKQANKPSKPKF